VLHTHISMGVADHAESPIAKFLIGSIDHYSIPVSIAVPLAMYVIYHLGALRNVCGNDLLGEYWKNGI